MEDFKDKLREIKEQLSHTEDTGNKGKIEKEKSIENNQGHSDLEYFNRYMEGVKRLKFDSIVIPRKNPKKHPFYNEDEETMNTLKMMIDGDIEFEISDTIEYIEGHIKDIDPNIMRKLKKGEISIESQLDLHGKTKEEAKTILKAFIEESRRKGIRCVRIIHGRGLHSKDYIPIIKEALKGWLVSKSIGRHILAFCSARKKDGGTGALYVLLRK